MMQVINDGMPIINCNADIILNVSVNVTARRFLVIRGIFPNTHTYASNRVTFYSHSSLFRIRISEAFRSAPLRKWQVPLEIFELIENHVYKIPRTLTEV